MSLSGSSKVKEPCFDGCKDSDLTAYDRYVGCGTPYCSGGHEVHCRRCGFFSLTCPCGCNNGYDTVSEKTRLAISRRGHNHEKRS